jgi:hypothetical protein
MRSFDRRRVPLTIVGTQRLYVEPYAMNDKIEFILAR